jgi:WD40 repeat protein
MRIKEKNKGNPRPRYGIWLFFGLVIGIVAAGLGFWGLFEPRRDMVFAESAEIPDSQQIFFSGYSPDWQSIYTQSSDGHFRVWDFSNQEISLLQEYDSYSMTLQWNADKTYFLGLDYEHAALLFDSLGARVSAYEHPGVNMALWNPRGDRVITIGQTEVKLWTVDARLLKEFPQPMVYFDSTLWSPDGSRFVLWTSESAGAMYDADGNELQSISLSGYPSNYSWNSTSSAFALAQYVPGERIRQAIVVYNREAEEIWSQDRDSEEVQLSWNADGSRLALLSYVEQAKADLYSIEGEHLAEFDTGNVFLWHPKGESLLTGTEGGRNMRLKDKNGNLIQVLAHDVDTRYSYPQWSPNGDILATWGAKPEESIYSLYLWDTQGNLLQEMSESTPIDSVIWSPDSSRILTIGGFVARIWSAAGGEINSLHHYQPIIHARWSSDSTRIWTIGSYASYVQYENAIWTNDGEHIATLVTGDRSLTYVSEWREDFSQVLVNTTEGVSILSLQAGPVYFDFRFDN